MIQIAERTIGSDLKPFIIAEMSGNHTQPLDRAYARASMQSYEFEKREYPHPRSPEALEIRAKMRGGANGVAYAEAFQVIRSIDKL